MILILIKCFPVLLLLFRRGGMVFYTLKRTTKRSIFDIFVKKEKKCCTSNGKYKRQEFILLFLFMFIFIPFPPPPPPLPYFFFPLLPFFIFIFIIHPCTPTILFDFQLCSLLFYIYIQTKERKKEKKNNARFK